jgi:hypothetical protein
MKPEDLVLKDIARFFGIKYLIWHGSPIHTASQKTQQPTS